MTEDNIYRATLMLSFDPEVMQLVIERKFAELRDRYRKELETLEVERSLAIKTRSRTLEQDVFERFQKALRLYDRYYVLADLQAKGTLTKERAW